MPGRREDDSVAVVVLMLMMVFMSPLKPPSLSHRLKLRENTLESRVAQGMAHTTWPRKNAELH